MSNNNDSCGCNTLLFLIFIGIVVLLIEEQGGLLRLIFPCTYEVNDVLTIKISRSTSGAIKISGGIKIFKKDHCDEPVYIHFQDSRSLPFGFDGTVKIEIINIESAYSYTGKILQFGQYFRRFELQRDGKGQLHRGVILKRLRTLDVI